MWLWSNNLLNFKLGTRKRENIQWLPIVQPLLSTMQKSIFEPKICQTLKQKTIPGITSVS